MLYPDARILIFAKPPIVGHCKTRLGRKLGMTRAAHIHRQLVELNLSTVISAAIAPVELHCDGGVQHPYFQHLRRKFQLPLVSQCRGHLGQRMHKASAHSLQSASATLIIGTDCPVMRPHHLEACLDALTSGKEAVFIPSEDGGYALVGLRKPMPVLFQGIEWGSAQVYKQTQQRLERSARPWTALPALWDIDDARDFKKAKRLGLL